MGLLGDLYAQNKVLAISPSLELEVIDAIKRRVTRHAKPNTPPEYADEEISSAITSFFAIIQKLDDAGKIIRKKNTELVDEYHKKILAILLRNQGNAVANLTGRLRHSGAGYRDIEHAYHAVLAHAEAFYTLDSGFRAVAGDPAFARVRFVILGMRDPSSGT